MVNASRCPDLVVSQLNGGPGPELLFEERPLGAAATVGRLANSSLGGTWLVANTDMIVEPPLAKMLEHHRRTRADWTMLVGPFPPSGEYGGLRVRPDESVCGQEEEDGCRLVHYLGYSVMDGAVMKAAGRRQCMGLFSDLLPAALDEGLRLQSFYSDSRWLDMGRMSMIVANVLEGGSFLHPGASVSDDASLEGRYNIGDRCRLMPGCVVRNAVMLEGSVLEGGVLEDEILPWSCRIHE
jgi:NDP-sugar pyrophosphorylase family protein